MKLLLVRSLLVAAILLPSGQLSVQSAQQLAATPKKASTPKKPVTPAKPEPPTQNIINKSTIEEGGIRYELTSCKRAEETLVCRLLLTNKSPKDVAVSFKVKNTRFIDITGEEYLAKEVQIGSNKSEEAVESILISQVPIRAMVTFAAPATNVVTLKVLAINHEPGSSLKFREVKIAKS